MNCPRYDVRQMPEPGFFAGYSEATAKRRFSDVGSSEHRPSKIRHSEPADLDLEQVCLHLAMSAVSYNAESCTIRCIYSAVL
jgi:hypothetical protein